MNKFTGKTVTLQTYGYGNAESRSIEFPIEWLEEQLAPHTLEDFLAGYTYDDSEHFEDQFRRDVRAFYEPLIAEALEQYDEDDEENNHLQCNYLEGGEKPEYVLNVGTIIIEDGLTQKEADRLYYILA